MHRFVPKSPRYPLACRMCDRVRTHENHYPVPHAFHQAADILAAMMSEHDPGTADHAALSIAVRLLRMAR